MIETYRRDDGVLVVNNCGFKVVVTIPSHRREKAILQNPLLRWANVCVHESEVENYRRALHDSGQEFGGVFAHQYDVTTFMRAGRDLYNPAEESFMITADDDLLGLVNMFTRISSRNRITDPFVLLDILCQDGYVAKQIPTGVWVYAQTPNPRERRTYLPFRIRGWGPESLMGIIDKEIKHDPNVAVKGDLDLCLQVVAKYKMIWIDQRFAPFYQPYPKQQGELIGARFSGADERDTRYLKKKWGDEVIGVGKQRSWGGLVTVNIPSRHMPEKKK